MRIDEQLGSDIEDTVKRVLSEDIGTGDLTAALIAEDSIIDATIITRDAMTMAGRPWVDAIYEQLDPQVILDWQINDGDTCAADSVICQLRGSARSILSGERAALNMLQTLSATATITAVYVKAIADTDCQILDTRKTIPGLRWSGTGRAPTTVPIESRSAFPGATPVPAKQQLHSASMQSPHSKFVSGFAVI